MKALLLLLLVACGAPPAKPTTPPAKPTTPPAVVEQAGTTALPSELTGAVKKIRVDGVGKAAIEAALAPAIGKAIDSNEVRAGLSAAAVAEGVADLTVYGVQLADGIELVVTVTPQPTLTKLVVIEAGGKTVPLGLGAIPGGGPLEPARVQQFAQTLRERYVSNGYYDADVAWKQTPSAGGVEVTIEVTPGEKSEIAGVVFAGNTQPKQELDKLVEKWLVVGQPVIADRITSFSTVLSAYYWDKGYANVRVVDPDVKAGKVTLTFKITEGPKFTFSTIDIKGVPATDKPSLLKLFGVKPGDVFTRTGIVTGRDKLIERLGVGKPNVNVLPLTKVDLPNKKIALTLEVTGL